MRINDCFVPRFAAMAVVALTASVLTANATYRYTAESSGREFSLCDYPYIVALVGFNSVTEETVIDYNTIISNILPAGSQSRVVGLFNGANAAVGYGSGGEFNPLTTMILPVGRVYGAFYVVYEVPGSLTFVGTGGGTASVDDVAELEFGYWHVNLDPCDDPFFGGGTVAAEDSPSSFTLAQNHPNPFNPSTVIAFNLAETSAANLSVYDLAGRKVATLVDGLLERGAHNVTFDASQLSSGLYFYTLNANGQALTQKMVLAR